MGRSPPVRSRPSRRSAAANGSSSWSATARSVASASPASGAARSRSTTRSATIARTWASARARRAALVVPAASAASRTARWRSSAASSSGMPAPVIAVVIMTSGRFGPRRAPPTAGGRTVHPGGRGRHRDEHGPQLRRGPGGAGPIALVHDHDVGDLEQAGLDRLDLVAHLGRLEDDGRVGGRGDLHLGLAGPDGLDEDEVEAHGVEDGACRAGRRREPAGMPARGHRPDEHVAVARIRLHPHPVAEDGAAGDRARRVDGDHRDGPARPADLGDERRDQRGLARAGRSRDAHEVRPPGGRIEPAEGGLGDPRAVLDRGQQAGERAAVPGEGRVRELGRAGGRFDRHATRAFGRGPGCTRRPGRSSSRVRTPPTPRPPRARGRRRRG